MIGKTDNPQIAHPSGFRAANSTALPHVAGAPARMPVASFYVTRPAAASLPAQKRVAPVVAEALPPGTYLQYVGFNQAGSVREYRFRWISRGEKPKELVMNAALPLFAKHHVAIQEGPALCLHILLKQGAASGTPAAPTPRSLTESDLLAHLASRPARQAKGGTNQESHFSSGASETR
jgi:hypothetical protein